MELPMKDGLPCRPHLGANCDERAFGQGRRRGLLGKEVVQVPVRHGASGEGGQNKILRESNGMPEIRPMGPDVS